MDGAERFRKLIDADRVSKDLKQTSVRGGFFSVGAEATDFVLRFGSILVFSRVLSPEYFGLYGMVVAVTLIFDRFKDLGLVNATVQKKDITHEQVSALFWINGAAGIVLMFIVMALAYPIAVFYKDMRLMPIALAQATTFPLAALALQHQALLRRQMRFGRIASIQVTVNLLSIGCGLFLALRGFGYWALVIREVSRNLFILIGTW
ncbi:MAG: oligosaccharide flippase family protein, partial [Verrucomicrobia bacterium]|nr:oligosaccharide flippase family protein [Verrucomicrobiota bacterium]